jgi:DnaJ-domain-containing protein 1
MIDYFALLQQPRRPWLDPEKLKEKYHEITKAAHPDRQSSASPDSDFANINEAYRVLLDPKLRLDHLLKLEGIPPASHTNVPEQIADVFLEIGTLIQETDRFLAKSTTTTALSKALLRPEILEKQKLTADLLEKLKTMYADTLKELKLFDQAWTSTNKAGARSSAISALSSRFAYLTRWIAQLEERKFQLSI